MAGDKSPGAGNEAAPTGLGHDPKCRTFGYGSPCPTARLGPAPKLAVDCIILLDGKVLLIHRRNPPHGWALPGGFVEYGESVEEAVRREMREETGLELEGLRQFRVYSDPGRDPRGHTVSVVFAAQGVGKPSAGDDADRHRLVDLNEVAETGTVPEGTVPVSLVFDHARILEDFVQSTK